MFQQVHTTSATIIRLQGTQVDWLVSSKRLPSRQAKRWPVTPNRLAACRVQTDGNKAAVSTLHLANRAGLSVGWPRGQCLFSSHCDHCCPLQSLYDQQQESQPAYW